MGLVNFLRFLVNNNTNYNNNYCIAFYGIFALLDFDKF